MKVNILEAHDRLIHLRKSQSDIIAQGCDDCLKKNPFSLKLQDKSPYIYIFAHPRQSDDGQHKYRMLWQPRLSKPQAQENSYLFRAKSHTDIIEICWIIPAKELWDQFLKGYVTENDIVCWSVNHFRFNKQGLEEPYSDDLSPEKIKVIYQEILTQEKYGKNHENLMERLYKEPMQLASEESLIFPSQDL